MLSLGSFPSVLLADARAALKQAHSLLEKGIDPSQQRKTDQAEGRPVLVPCRINPRAPSVRVRPLAQAVLPDMMDRPRPCRRRGRVWRALTAERALRIVDTPGRVD